MNVLQNMLPKLNLKSSEDGDPCDKVHRIPVCRILPNPAQPRKYFDNNETLRLADSIRRHGILQPLCVRKPVSAGDLSEYGGIAWPMPGHEPPRRTYGYGTAAFTN